MTIIFAHMQTDCYLRVNLGQTAEVPNIEIKAKEQVKSTIKQSSFYLCILL